MTAVSKPRKAPHCGALWPSRGRLRLRPFILCFYRTAFTVQKSGLKSSVFRSKPFPQISPKSYRHNAVPNRFSSRFSTSLTNGTRLLSQAKAGTQLGFRRKIAHNGSHGETGAFPPSSTAWSCAAGDIPFIPPRFYIHTFPGSL